MQRWRLIFEDGVTAEHGAAADAWFAGRPAGDPVLRLYTHRPHAAVLGRHQAATVLRPDFCAARGIAVTRRATGGGALLLGPEQLCVSAALPAAAAAALGAPYENLVTVLRRFARPLVSTLRLFSMQAEVVGRGDITVADRLIAPIAFDRLDGGGFLLTYHLFVSFDPALVAGAFSHSLFGPAESVADRVTTVQTEIGEAATVAFLRKGLAESYAATLGVELEPSVIAPAEAAAIAALAEAAYTAPACLASPSIPEGANHAAVAGDFGEVEVHLTCAGEGICEVSIIGDHCAIVSRIKSLAASLTGIPAEPRAVQAAAEGAWAAGNGLPGLTPADLTVAVLAAARPPVQ